LALSYGSLRGVPLLIASDAEQGELDRLSRRHRDGVALLAHWCERGVRVVAVTEQIDLSGAVGRMVASVLFGLAEIESEYRRERQASGIAVAKERGVYRGRQRGTTKALPRRAGSFESGALRPRRSPRRWGSADERPSAI